jgi:hypothetical protein
VKHRNKRRERHLFISPSPIDVAEKFVSRSTTSGLAEILFTRRRSATRTEWRYDPVKETLNVSGSDFVIDLRTVRNRIIEGEISSDIQAIIYKGVFVIRGQHLRDWLGGVVPHDRNDC